MLSKPKDCVGCPFAGDMQGFVPDELRENAPVFIYAQGPGADEEAGRRIIAYIGQNPIYEPYNPAPLTGATGYKLEHDFLPRTGFSREQVSMGNAIRCRFNHHNDLPPLDYKNLRDALIHCHKAYFKLPSGTKLIVSLGEYSLYALTQTGLEKDNTVTSWRGFLLPFEPLTQLKTARSDIWNPSPRGPLPVFSMLHTAFLFKNPDSLVPMLSDWNKVSRILAGKWPLRLPLLQDGPIEVWPLTPVAFDTEYVPKTGKLIRFSLANESVLRVVEASQQGNDIALVLKQPAVLITHNALADIEHFESITGQPEGSYLIEDTMYLHAVLWAGLDHDLNFLGSLYARINRWKHLERSNPIVYSAGDALGTWDSWLHLEQSLKADLLSEPVYGRRKKLIPIIRKSRKIGIQVNQARALEIAQDMKAKTDELKFEAQALAGWPINLLSNPQVAQQLYDTENLKEFALPGRVKKVYAKTN